MFIGLFVHSLRIVPVAPFYRLVESVDGGITLWQIYQV